MPLPPTVPRRNISMELMDGLDSMVFVDPIFDSVYNMKRGGRRASRIRARKQKKKKERESGDSERWRCKRPRRWFLQILSSSSGFSPFSLFHLFVFDFLFYYSINLIGFWNNSKTYCPFCVSVKKLLSELGATFKVVELDTESKFFIFPFLYSFHHPLSISLSPLLFYCLRSFNFSTGNELVRMTCGKLLCIQTCPN